MDTDVRSYFGKSSKLLNILGHEVFHIGYFECQPRQTEVWSDNYVLQVVLTTLQNDGMAVYTQQQLSALYPAPAEIDLLLLDSRLAVRFLLKRVNGLLQEAEALREEDAMTTAFTGMNQRALYVVGAHMARVIDEELGRDALVETVSQGPRSFIETYNSVADRGMEVYEVDEPETLSDIQALRKAAVNRDYGAVQETIDRMAEENGLNRGGETFEHLSSTGLVLLHDRQPDLAVQVLRLLVAVFPDHPHSHVHLGDSLSQSGETAEAQASYRLALELDPKLTPAIRQ
jgi:hypothetical protein